MEALYERLLVSLLLDLISIHYSICLCSGFHFTLKRYRLHELGF
jgi:hypothetical protein